MTQKQKKRLFRIILVVPLFTIACAMQLDGIWKIGIFLIPYGVAGYDVVWSAVRNIARGQIFDEQFLMTIATVGAFGVGELPEAVLVMWFYQVGELFENIAVGKSRKSIAALMDIRPDYAVVLRDEGEAKVSPEEVSIGEVIIVRPGEKIPLDGMVVSGTTAVNTAALTGESLPRDVGVGERVISGSVNISGVVLIKTDNTYGESTVSKILNLVENASCKKAKAENFITRFAKYYTPCVVIGACLLAVLPPILLSQSFMLWLNRALIFLVVSCPCALVISVPLSFFGGIGGASRDGILIKGANYLEILANTKIVVFDKTGTLTKGSFFVTAIHPNKVPEGELLDITAAAESYSRHPIATSIIEAHGGHIDTTRIGEVTEIPGQGIKAVIDGRTIYVGNGALMDFIGAAWRECHHVGTIVHISEGNEYLGHIVISDEIKPDSVNAISDLKSSGVVKTVMLTGDKKNVGESVAKQLSVDEVYTELMPDDKVAAVEQLLTQKLPLAFVGDGINDAPVLSRADVGIAMGALGSDAAIEAADIVLMDDKPSKVAKAIRLSRRTMRIVKQNIIFALGIKACVLLLSAFGYASMWIAVFADVGVMILALLNAMRCLKKMP